MIKRMKILFGYDGSPNADAALEDLKVAGLPDSVDAIVVSVADVFLPPPIEDPEEVFPKTVPHSVRLAQARAKEKLAEATALAERAAKKIKNDFPAWNVDYEAVANSPAWALISKASDWDVDLIVVGALGHTVLGGRLILGSVSQRVLHEARSSVRIARAPRHKDDEPFRLLVGVDNSIYSNAAVEAIANRTWPAGTQVRLLAVLDTVMAIEPEPGSSELRWIEVGDEEHWDQVRKIFRPLIDKLNSRGLDAALMIRRGEPKEEILDEAESWAADSIFVGSKGIRGVERLLLGSVSSAVSARAECSVEVVRPT